MLVHDVLVPALSLFTSKTVLHRARPATLTAMPHQLGRLAITRQIRITVA
jgi:hypothetical protein